MEYKLGEALDARLLDVFIAVSNDVLSSFETEFYAAISR